MFAASFELRALWFVRLAAAVAVLLGLQLSPSSTAHAEPASALISDMVVNVNQVRAQAGLPALVESSTLSAVAEQRSRDMVLHGYFSHTAPDGRTVFSLLHERGIQYAIAGENLAWNTGYEQASTAAVEAFLASPPHRENLLRLDYREIGVGVANRGDRVYFTLVFTG